MLRYLTVGHICKDLTPDGWAFGGTVSYSARAAQALGCEVNIVTSTEAELDLTPAVRDARVVRSISDHTTTFENIYTPGGRIQRLHAVADRLKARDFKLSVRPIDILHLAPIAQEVDRDWLDTYDGALIGVSPQGWLRQWDSSGHVSSSEWSDAAEILARADAVVISIEDVNGDQAVVDRWAAQTRHLIVTRGYQGCTLYLAGQPIDLPAPVECEVDPTGAGDIFAAAFFIRLRQIADPIVAARFANCIAAKSITRRGLDGVPNLLEIEQCLQSTR